MSLAPYQAHVRECAVCAANPSTPCATGATLLAEGAARLTRDSRKNPRRPRA